MRGNFQFTGTKNLLLQDVRSVGSMMDGFYVAGLDGAESLKGARIVNCIADDAYRNGLTLSNTRNAIVDGGRFINSGMNYGTLPMGGIDVESDWETTINDGAVIRNAYFTNNEVMGLAISFRSHNTLVDGCYFDNENASIYFIDVEGVMTGNTVQNCTFKNCSLGERINHVRYLGNKVVYEPTSISGDSVQNYFIYLYDKVDPTDYVEFRGNRFEVKTGGIHSGTTYLNIGRVHFGTRDNVIFEDNTVINMLTYGGFSGYMLDYGSGQISIKNNKFILAETRFAPQWSTFKSVSVGSRLNLIKDNEFVGYNKTVTMPLTDNRYSSVSTGQFYKRSFILGYQTLHKITPLAIAYQTGSLSNHIRINATYYGQKAQIDVVIDGTSVYYTMKAFTNGSPTNTIPTFIQVWHKNGELFVKGMNYFVTIEYESVTTGGNGDGTQAIDPNINIIADATEGDQTGGTALGFTAHSPSAFATTDMTNLIKPTGHCVYITSLAKPVWWSGSVWVDATGTIV